MEIATIEYPNEGNLRSQLRHGLGNRSSDARSPCDSTDLCARVRLRVHLLTGRGECTLWGFSLA